MTVWNGLRVLVTGHTGFKGSWLALWLHDLGAEVTGFSLPPPSDPSLFEAARVSDVVRHVEGDVRNADDVEAAVRAARPEVVFHLAAQPLVRRSYEEPVETYATNVMGTVHVLDAVRRVGGVRAAICITSDKCYENREWVWPYRESDPMGGHDPYSSSKGAAELVIAAYRRSYFDPAQIESHGLALASVRAGNVIGGADWASDRLVPDIVRAMQTGERLEIRNPNSVRPWQHVLEALGGYILLAERMLAGEAEFADGWNFGPADEDARPVRWIVDRLTSLWGGEQGWDSPATQQPHEAGLLKLDCTKARGALGWRPAMNLDSALRCVAEWHQAHDAGGDGREITLRQIRNYRRAVADGVSYTEEFVQ
jgi:CDP-glucose 4,6-dehydratase